MPEVVDVDYLVVGAGATGMAFTDTLIDHADVRVALVDRREAVGGHWLEAYPFVRLHQASQFYGVASTVLGGEIQQDGPEAGLNERADQLTICGYYDGILHDRMLASGRVELFVGHDYLGDRTFRARGSGRLHTVPDHCRIVDARYLSPDIPAESPAPFAVADDAHVVPVNDVVSLEEAPSQYVVVGSGKTATDTIVWLLNSGVDPDAICWVRPRDPWMLNRALIQPDPVIYLGMVAEMLRICAEAPSLPEAFLGLEDAGIMLRIDRGTMPTMARAPTLGTWELDLLRSIEHVVRLGHVRSVRRGRLELEGRRRRDRRGRRGRPLRGRRAEDQAPAADLAARGDHAAGGPGRLPVLRRRAVGVRRGDPRRRHREEPGLPAIVVRQHPRGLGGHERQRPAQLRGVRCRARPQGVRGPGVAEPLPGPTRPPGLTRARRRAGRAAARRRTSRRRPRRMGWDGLVKYDVIAPTAAGTTADPDWIAEWAQHVEACGFDGVVAVEHAVVFADTESRYPYDASGRMDLPDDCDIPDPIELLTFLAGSTTTLGLATGVLVLPDHHPVVLAKRLATLSRLSKGAAARVRRHGLDA